MRSVACALGTQRYSNNMKTTTVLVKCGKCDGSGRYARGSRFEGVCFGCNGTGKFTAVPKAVKGWNIPSVTRAEAIAKIQEILVSLKNRTFRGSDASWNIAYICLGLSEADQDVARRAEIAVNRHYGDDNAFASSMRELRDLQADRIVHTNVRKVG